MSTSNDRRSVTDAELIESIKNHPDRAVKASEVAEDVDLTSTRVNQLLRELEAKGTLESKSFGSGLAWWVTDQPNPD